MRKTQNAAPGENALAAALSQSAAAARSAPAASGA